MCFTCGRSFVPAYLTSHCFACFWDNRLCLLHFFISHLTWLTGTRYLLWYLELQQCVLPLTFSCSPCSRCHCYSFGLNSTGFMRFLDIINFTVTGPQCSYGVVCSITYICKTKGSFCQRGRRKAIIFSPYSRRAPTWCTDEVFTIRKQCFQDGTLDKVSVQ